MSYDNDLLVTDAAWNLLTFGERLVLANLVGDGNANFLWDGDTALLWLLVASLVGNLPCVGLLHILALVIGNTLAGAVNGSPNLVVALPLPLVLAILLVLRRAFGFWKKAVKFCHNRNTSCIRAHQNVNRQIMQVF